METSRKSHMPTGTFHSETYTSGAGVCPNAAASLHLVLVFTQLLGPPILHNHSQPQKILVLEITSLDTTLKTAQYLSNMRQLWSMDSAVVLDPRKWQHPAKETQLCCWRKLCSNPWQRAFPAHCHPVCSPSTPCVERMAHAGLLSEGWLEGQLTFIVCGLHRSRVEWSHIHDERFVPNSDSVNAFQFLDATVWSDFFVLLSWFFETREYLKIEFHLGQGVAERKQWVGMTI